MQAIVDGVPGSRVKDRMAELEARKAELEALLAEAKEEPVLQLYRQQIARLVEARWRASWSWASKAKRPAGAGRS